MILRWNAAGGVIPEQVQSLPGRSFGITGTGYSRESPVMKEPRQLAGKAS